MSNTRTANELQALLQKHHININDANAFINECRKFQDPKTIHAIYDLVDAFYSSEDKAHLATQLGVGNSIEELLVYIPEVVHQIQEEQKKHSKDKNVLTGEDLVRAVVESITAILDPKKIASLFNEHDSPQNSGEKIVAPLEDALTQIGDAVPDLTIRQKGDNGKVAGNVRVGIFITDNFPSIARFTGCAAMLGGIACVVAGILSANPVGLMLGLYGAVHLFGLSGVLLPHAFKAAPNNMTKNTVEAQVVASRTDTSTIEMGVFGGNKSQKQARGTDTTQSTNPGMQKK